ncbi:hypothetical protein GLOIN_2v1848417 [Rhizophagus clarus]|uniref:Uncharacterized protein n=2 Tax=Rhizophagus clarus TaxID=94130 RepID=A0A8H3LA16_9GLOM|nr:hypothetical protein GLOIN_2v1848417 [Rhizophagus clarus]
MAKFYDTQDNITKALAEAEKYTLSQMNVPSSIPVFPAANPYVDTNRSGGGMTKNEIEDLIKTTMTMSRATKTLDNSKKSANKRGEDLIIRRFLSELLRGRGNSAPSDDYNYDSVDDITDSMAGMTLNSATINAINSAVRSAVKKCIKCGRFGHTSQPDSDSDSSSNNTSSSDSSDSDTSSSDSSDSDEIYFVQKKEPETSVATVKCKIKHLKIPAMTLNSRAEPLIITENIVERIGAKIDKSEIHDLEGISTVPVESIGVVRNLPITLASRLTIIEDFIVMRYRKPTLIFSNKLLKKYGCAVDWSTEELKIPFNEKIILSRSLCIRSRTSSR